MSITKESVRRISNEMLGLAATVEETKHPDYTPEELARDIRRFADRVTDARHMERLEDHRKFLEEESHDEGELAEWYIHSVSSDDPPVWTEAHLRELVQDYWLIPKPMDERFKRSRKNGGGK